ncbi:MAG: septum formation inhibitor Maf [Deltaproteobacteria bacterium]|nr:septum formation inhibitor Maf [Deltaproteobacteria bacterium]
MSGIITSERFILASASPRRVELLTLLGLPFEIVPSDVEEAFLPGETPRKHVLRLSEEKARRISERYPEAWVMGADTIVIINGEVLGKPRTSAEAKDMLAKLSGQVHRVFTGFAVMRMRGDFIVSDAVESSVLFREIPEDEMVWYIRSEEPYDKAGAYAVQGMGAFFIKEIRGSYTNVMGLPLCEVVDVLKRIGAIRFSGGDNGINGKR